jgi:uncharacterized protein (TIGR02145 family)
VITFSINAQEPVIKFYLNKGGNKTYKLSDIKNIGVMKADSSFIMKIFYQKSKTASYLTASVTSLKIEDNLSNLSVYTIGDPGKYKLSEIDSIVLYPVANFKPVIICEHIFMSKNMDVDHYSNGDEIPQVWNRFAWDSLNKAKTGAWCYYNNDPELGKIYGKLYNWYAVNDSRGLCPKGWHVSDDTEWAEMLECLGGAYIAGKKLKATGTDYWDYCETAIATNESGFTALPGGWRQASGGFSNTRTGLYAVFWSSTSHSDLNAYYYMMSYEEHQVRKLNQDKRMGASVRCVMNK